MNDTDKKAFMDWLITKLTDEDMEYIKKGDISPYFKPTYKNGKPDINEAWQSACDYKQKEIDELKNQDQIIAKEIKTYKHISDKLHFELDRMNNYTIPGYQQGIEELQNIIEKLQAENKDMISKLKCLKSDYWFMTTLIERYSSDKEQALNDCLERMKFRKPLFNF